MQKETTALRRGAKLLGMLSLLVLPSTVRADGPTVGPEFQVNTYTSNDQSRSAVALDSAGNFVVVWMSDSQDGADEGVFGQLFDADGIPAGDEFLVTTSTASGQRNPAVAAVGISDFVVVWDSYLQDGSLDGVFGQRLDASGNPLGGEFQINTYTTSSQKSPAVAANSSGSFVVAWHSYLQDGSDNGIFGQRFDAAGDPVGSEFQINTYTTARQLSPSVNMGSGGAFVVVWHSQQDGSEDGVFGQRFDADGDPLGDEFQVNTHTTNSQQRPKVASDSTGNFVVVWQSYLQDGSENGVFGQRFEAGGDPLGGEFEVNTFTGYAQNNPGVALDDTGNFVVVWASYEQDGSDAGVFGRRFDAGGSPQGAEFQVNTYTLDPQRRPAIASDSSGRFVVVWEDASLDGSGDGIFGQRYQPNIFADGFESGDTSAWSNTVP